MHVLQYGEEVCRQLQLSKIQYSNVISGLIKIKNRKHATEILSDLTFFFFLSRSTVRKNIPFHVPSFFSAYKQCLT